MSRSEARPASGGGFGPAGRGNGVPLWRLPQATTSSGRRVSVDTYLRFAEAVNRLDLTQTEMAGLPELTKTIGESGAKHKVKGAIEGVGDDAQEAIEAGKEKTTSAFERAKEKVRGR